MLIWFISLIAIGSIIFINFVSFGNIEDIFIDQLKHGQETETDHATTQIIQHIHQVGMDLTTLSRFPGVGTYAFESGNVPVFQSLLESSSALLMVDATGNVWQSSAGDYNSWIGLNIMNKDYFAIPAETKQRYVQGFLRQGTNIFVIVSVPLFETSALALYPNVKGEFRGVALAIIELEDLYRLYMHSLEDSNQRNLLLVDVDSGETVLKSSALPEFSELRDEFPSAPVVSAIAQDFLDYGDTIITSSDIWVGSEKWSLLVLAPVSHYSEEWKALRWRHLLGLGLVVVSLGSALLITLSFYRSREEIRSRLDRATVTLDNLGIAVEPEPEDTYAPTDIMLKEHNIYLIRDGEENHAHELFIGTLNRGFAGLGIVREDPLRLRERYNLQKTPFIWLSKTSMEGVPSETRMATLLRLIREFAEKGKKSVILIDRLDYLIAENSFPAVLKAVQELRDLTRKRECIVLLSVNPELMDAQQARQIEAESLDLFGGRQALDLSTQELEMLRLINEGNVTNRLVSFTDITKHFDITKPTTRRRVSRLQGLGLLRVEQRGRVKSLRITSSGRRLLD